MTDFLSPGSNTQQVRKGRVAIPSISVGRAAFQGIAQKGPISKPVLITGSDDFTEVFGKFVNTSFLADAVNQFFDEGGQDCYVNRVEHYTNVTDSTSLVATAASVDLSTGTSAASNGFEVSNASSFPAPLVAGTVIAGKVNGVAGTGFTITATAATIILTGGSYAAGASTDSITITVAGVLGSQVVDLSAVAGTQQAYVNALNAALIGVRATISAANIILSTTHKGLVAAANVAALGGAAATKLGATVAAFVNAGPSNVNDDRAVTSAEFVGLMTSGFAGSTAVANGTGDRVTWTTGTPGTGGSVQFTGPATLATLVPGFDLNVHSGTTAGGIETTLTISASSEGDWGNAQRVSSTRVNTNVAVVAVTPAGAATVVPMSSVARLLIGDTISVTKGGDTQRGVVTKIDSVAKSVTVSPGIVVPAGGYAGTEAVVNETLTVKSINEDGVNDFTFSNLRMSPTSAKNFVENVINNTSRTSIHASSALVAPSTSVDPRPLDTVSAQLSGGADDIPNIVDTDYIGAAAGLTGIHAFDNIDDFLLGPMCPGITTVGVQVAQQAYAESRQDIFMILENPQGLSPSDMLTYVQTTANFFSSYVAMYYPWVKETDLLSNGLTSFPPCGMVAGVYARTFQNRNFGKAPAGTKDGVIRNALDVDFDVKKAVYDTLYPARINAIQKKRGSGICVFGSRTFDSTGEFGQVSTQMTFLVVKKVFDQGTEDEVFENNNPTTRAAVKRFMTLYLRELRVKEILEGTKDSDAFFIICDESNNTAAVRAQGKLKCRVGLATENPSEFIEVTLERDTRAIDAQLASQQ